MVYGLVSITSDLGLSVFPWARAVQSGHGGIKLHTLLDIRGAIPTVLHVTPAHQHDVHMLDRLVPETGAVYRVESTNLGVVRQSHLHCAGAFCVMRAKQYVHTSLRYSHHNQESGVVACDKAIILASP